VTARFLGKIFKMRNDNSPTFQRCKYLKYATLFICQITDSLVITNFPQLAYNVPGICEVAASLHLLRGSNFQVRTAVSAGLMPLSRKTAR